MKVERDNRRILVSDLPDRTSILEADTPAAAGARTIIKRTLRKQRLPVSDDAEELAGYFMARPWACTAGIERALQNSARAYERGDTTAEQRYARQVETLMALLEVRLTWPGLYPTYIYMLPKPAKMPPGLFAREVYDLGALWRLLRDVRKYA